jgi:hypothetical protein
VRAYSGAARAPALLRDLVAHDASAGPSRPYGPLGQRDDDASLVSPSTRRE